MSGQGNAPTPARAAGQAAARADGQAAAQAAQAEGAATAAGQGIRPDDRALLAAGGWRLDEDPEGLLPGLRAFLLDLDGTVYLDESWIEGAREFLARLTATGRRWCFLTNNSSKSARAYIEKLARMGLAIDPDTQLLTSGQATARYLLRRWPGQPVYLLGNPALRQEFEAMGVPLVEEDPALLVSAFDTSFDYPKLCHFCALVRSGLPYLATHPDYNCPTKHGFVPDIGALHAYVQASTGRMPDEIIGKPNAGIVDEALAMLGAARAEAAMVGDRLYTDIPAGNRNGLCSILVLSGETHAADLAAAKPDERPRLIFRSVKELGQLL